MRIFTFALLLITLTACGSAASAPESDSTGSTGASAPASIVAASPAAPSNAAPAETATAGASNGVNLGNIGQFEQRITAFLGTQINKPAEQLVLQSREEMEWRDSSLGCPDPATMYMQVIVPGYRLTYTDGTRTYEVHTDQSGNQVVWCDNGTPKTIGQP